jgi:hypothetical protein
MSEQESLITFHSPAREVMRIVPTETGVDVVVADGITMTEAAVQFIKTVRALLSNDVTYSRTTTEV